MGDGNEKQGGMETLLAAWMKMATDFWGKSINQMAPQDSDEAASDGLRGGWDDSWKTALHTWQSLTKAASDPASVAGLSQGIGGLPEFQMKMMLSAFSGFLQLQQKWLERSADIVESSGSLGLDYRNQDGLGLFSEFYEKEIRPFLNIPALGLARFYQERAGQAIDKFAQFQGAMTEFMKVLSGPMENSVRLLQQELGELGNEEELPESSKEYYQRWIKILEGQYMTLFKSTEYTRIMGKTLKALEEFSAAKTAVLQDLLNVLPIPNQKEMDELYREIYLLKKRVKMLEKDN